MTDEIKKTQQNLQTNSHWWAPPKGVQCIRKLYKTNEMSFTMCEKMGYAERDTTTSIQFNSLLTLSNTTLRIKVHLHINQTSKYITVGGLG